MGKKKTDCDEPRNDGRVFCEAEIVAETRDAGDGKTETIADNVRSFDIAQSGELLYMSDVVVLNIDFEEYVGGGDLYVYKNGESKLIDSEVTDVITNGSNLDYLHLW